MFRDCVLFSALITLVTVSGPMGFALSSHGNVDDAGLYLVVGTAPMLDRILVEPGIQEIGPYRAPFARIVHTSQDFHPSLVADGYWTIPATRLAELCGVQLNT